VTLYRFDSTPTGRIVNRFSSDLSTLDEALPTTMAMFLNMLLSLLATIATIAILLPWVLLGLLPLGVYYASVLRYYNTSNRELKRLDSVSKSPIFSLFGETLQGLASIRAFKKEPFYSNRITSLIDGYGPHIITQLQYTCPC
jgi:ABC-type multidrug transport system fused ATPase/permease subunit